MFLVFSFYTFLMNLDWFEDAVLGTFLWLLAIIN